MAISLLQPSLFTLSQRERELQILVFNILFIILNILMPFIIIITLFKYSFIPVLHALALWERERERDLDLQQIIFSHCKAYRAKIVNSECQSKSFFYYEQKKH